MFDQGMDGHRTMRRNDDQIDGDLVVESDDAIEVVGLVTGNITVKHRGVCLLSGMVRGNLIIESGGGAAVQGMVCGNVRNDGRVNVTGTVKGLVGDTSGGVTIGDGAMINGKRLSPGALPTRGVWR